MASIRKRNDKYQAQFKYRGYYRAKTFDRISDARDWIQEEHKRVVGEFNVTKKVKPKNTAEVLDRYRKEVTPKKRGAHSENLILNKLLKEHWVKIPIHNLCRTHIASYRDKRLIEVTPATFKRQWGIVLAAIAKADLEWNYQIPIGLFKSLPIPRTRVREIKRISPSEQTKLLEYAEKLRTPQFSNIIQIALITGMRRGEILKIKRTHIDTHYRTLHIPDTKTGNPRTIPLTESTMKVISEFARATDKPSPNALRLAWERLRKKCDLENLRFHDLRHEAISKWFDLGLSAVEVMHLSGHKSMQQVQRYAHANFQNIRIKLFGNSNCLMNVDK